MEKFSRSVVLKILSTQIQSNFTNIDCLVRIHADDLSKRNFHFQWKALKNENHKIFITIITLLLKLNMGVRSNSKIETINNE
jgi:UDP-2,3-diacylglucosamine pyrophosphatase LpxH